MAAPKGNNFAVGHGPPKGSMNGLKHGLIFLKKSLKSGKIEHLRGVGKMIETLKAELVRDLGGDLSTQEKVIIDDTAKVLVFVNAIDGYLFNCNLFETKGAAGWLEERRRLAEHVTKNLKAVGLKRIARDVSNDLDKFLASITPRDSEVEARGRTESRTVSDEPLTEPEGQSERDERDE
jgi:DNA polymerase/3'-5' exonuclease PolX